MSDNLVQKGNAFQNKDIKCSINLVQQLIIQFFPRFLKKQMTIILGWITIQYMKANP